HICRPALIDVDRRVRIPDDASFRVVSHGLAHLQLVSPRMEARSMPPGGTAALLAESVLPDERNEDHRFDLALREGWPVWLHGGWPLRLAGSARHGQASPIRRQLLERGSRDRRTGGGDVVLLVC